MAEYQLGYIMQNTPTQTMQQTHKIWNKPAFPCIIHKRASTDLKNILYSPVTYPTTYVQFRWVRWCFLRWWWMHEYAENKTSLCLHLSNHLLCLSLQCRLKHQRCSDGPVWGDSQGKAQPMRLSFPENKEKNTSHCFFPSYIDNFQFIFSLLLHSKPGQRHTQTHIFYLQFGFKKLGHGNRCLGGGYKA